MVSNKMIVTFMLIAVTSLAAVGCSDDNPVTPNNIDTAPLIPPTDLTVELDKGKAVLDWDPSLDHRTSNYVVTRERNGLIQNLGITGNDVSMFVDESPLAGTAHYHVYGMANGGQASSEVTASLTITLYRQPVKLEQ